MTVILFPKKSIRVRRPAANPEKRVCEAVNDLMAAQGEEEAFHFLADLAEKVRKSLRKAQKQRKK